MFQSPLITQPGLRRFAAPLLLVFLTLAANSTALHAQIMPLHGLCRHCSSIAAYANAAMQAAPDYAPADGTSMTYPVYVLNSGTGTVEFFNVLVWYDWGNGQPHGSDRGDSSSVTTRQGGVTMHTGLHKEAYPATGDPAIIGAMQQAHQSIFQFYSPANLHIDSTDLPGTPPESAVDLVGDGPAGYDRLNLELALSLHYRGVWASIGAALNDLAQRFLSNFIGNSDYFNSATTVTVSFPDGSQVDVEFESVSDGPSGVIYEMRVRPDSARLPNGQGLPQTPEHFDGFGYSGDTQLIDAIGDLAWRMGITVTGGPSGSRLACSRVQGGGPVTCRMLQF